MQIVIDIDEEDFNIMKHNVAVDNPLCPLSQEEIVTKIAHGTPLPKGHGKLIAEPTEEDIAKTVGGQNDFAECIRDAVRMVFVNAPTIIEAEKESELNERK